MISNGQHKERTKTKRLNGKSKDETKYQKHRRKKAKKAKRMGLYCGGLLVALSLIWTMSIYVQEDEDEETKARRFAARLIRKRKNSNGGSSEEAASSAHGDPKGHVFKRPKRRILNDALQDENNEETINPEQISDMFDMMEPINHAVRTNAHTGVRWLPKNLLRELPGQEVNALLASWHPPGPAQKFPGHNAFFRVKRTREKPLDWEDEWNNMSKEQQERGPKVDYTKHEYTYATPISSSIPENYPPLEPMEKLLKRWPQDELDSPPSPIVEQLMHFNFSIPEEREMAKLYRDAHLPFKVYDVPEVLAANRKWTDSYVSSNFDSNFLTIPRSQGQCQESVDNFFAFFTPVGWQLSSMGPPPTRDNDWPFATWAKHARYADAVGLGFDQPHFYYQSGVPKEERLENPGRWTFVSRDLPSFSSPTDTFFAFHVEDQKGIQCRFGERGVTAATHYDSGQNMVAMVHGAKRYILSPPKECSKLGIVLARGNTLYRHSLLNFGHLHHVDDESVNANMSQQERKWLQRAGKALAVETVLKSGEVLFIPSHWFHYITSVQKSAQCNVRSGIDLEGTRKYGGPDDVHYCED